MRSSALVLPSLLLALGVSSCGRGAAAPGAGDCDLAAVGPLIGYSYDLAPPAAASGGTIEDGTYDLTQIIEHGKASGPSSSNTAPAFRWALRFTTDERSPNHAEGRMVMAINLPPASTCDGGRFATIGTELRTLSKKPELGSEQYSATPDGVTILTKGTTYVFHRRP